MKNSIYLISIAVLFVSSLFEPILNKGLADTPPSPSPSPSVSPAASIKVGMKQIGALFKAISKVAKDSSQNAASAENARQLAINFQSVMNLIPDEIKKLPEPQQAAAIIDYQKMIQQEIDASIALEKAFLANDNNSALTILDQMTVTKKEGHSKYNPWTSFYARGSKRAWKKRKYLGS